MALPPTIPTSFVPKQPVPPSRRAHSGMNLLLLIAMIAAGLALFGAAATFGYTAYLESVRDSKAAKLAEAEKSINRDTVEEFIRLRNRIRATETLLDNHILLSQFFILLESLSVTNVHFESLALAVEDDRSATIIMRGTARNFNALAAESTAFAGEKRIRRAIFSGISSTDAGTVTFSLSAELDPRVITWDGQAAAVVTPSLPASPAQPVFSTSTATTTAP